MRGSILQPPPLDKPASWLICAGDAGSPAMPWPGVACSAPQTFAKGGLSPTEDGAAPGASGWERGPSAAEPSRMFGGAGENF